MSYVTSQTFEAVDMIISLLLAKNHRKNTLTRTVLSLLCVSCNRSLLGS